MKNFQIHFLGKTVKDVPTKIDAIWHLGAKYGALRFNEAVKRGHIVIFQDFILVRPSIETIEVKREILN